MGTTNYDLMGTPDQNIFDTIDWQSKYFNLMRVSLRPKRDLWDKSPDFDINLANPFGGTWNSPSAGWNSQYWNRFHAMMTHAASKGVIIELIICRDDREEYDPLQNSATFNNFIKATDQYWNLIYCISNEWYENISESQVNNLANRIKNAISNNHLITVHGKGNDLEDFMEKQWLSYANVYEKDSPDDINSEMRTFWYSWNKAVVDGEYGYEGREGLDAIEVLKRHWAALAGGAMAWYGHSVDRLKRLVYDWKRLGKSRRGTHLSWLYARLYERTRWFLGNAAR